MITRVKSVNVRGHDREVTLGRKTLVVGPNGSGKSTVSVTAHWTLLGYVPGLAKTGAALMSNARAEFMDGEVDVDGVVIKRRLLSKDGKTSERVRIGAVEAKGNSADGMIEMALRRPAARVLFDSSAFWGLSDAQRIHSVLTIMGGADAEKLIAGQREAKDALNDVRAKRKGALAAVESISARLAQMPPARPQSVIMNELDAANAALSTIQGDLAKGGENDRRRKELNEQVAGLEALRAEAAQVHGLVVSGRRDREVALRLVEEARQALEKVPASLPGRSPWINTDVLALLQELRGMASTAPKRPDIVSRIDRDLVVSDPVNHDAKRRECQQVVDRAAEQVRALEKAIESNVRRAGTLQERVRLWAKAAAELERVGPGVSPESEAAEAGASALVKQLTDELSAAGRRAGVESEMEAANLVAERGEQAEDEAKKKLEDATGKILALLSSMTAEAERVASALLPYGRLVFDMAGISDGKFILAWATDVVHAVDRRALSGGEGVLFDAAVCRLLGGPDATLFIEAGECDDSTLAKSLSTIAKNDAGQVVIMRWTNAGQAAPVVDGWEVVAL